MDTSDILDKRQLREIDKMFSTLPKRISQKNVWKKFWKEVSADSVEAAKQEAPVSKKDHAYPREKDLIIKRGTLRDSIQFFQTKASNKPWFHGAYVGPRVKGKYRKEKGGFYGAWVEYGGSVKHFGKYKSEDNDFMNKAWKRSVPQMKGKGIRDAGIIFDKEVKRDAKRINKYGRLGY